MKPSRVLKLLSKLHVAKGTCLDQICSKILKFVARPVIYRQLTDLFNLSLKRLKFPDDWKLAKVFPTFKIGERKNPNNHRPISVLLTVSRVFEKLVYEQVYHYLVINNIYIRSTSIWLQIPLVNIKRLWLCVNGGT